MGKGTKSVHVGARIEQAVSDALEVHMQKVDRTKSWIINEALKYYLSPKPLKP